MDRCAFCHSLVDDGDYLHLRGSKYRIGNTCGCSKKTSEELLEIIYFKSFPIEDLIDYKNTCTRLANHPFTDERDKKRLLKSISVMDIVIAMHELKSINH